MTSDKGQRRASRVELIAQGAQMAGKKSCRVGLGATKLVELALDQARALPPRVFGETPVAEFDDQSEPAWPLYSIRKADRARRRLVSRLRSIDTGSMLADALEGCGATSGEAPKPCWRGSCPTCGRLIQRWLAWSGPLTFRRVVKARGRSNGQLNAADLCRITLTSSPFDPCGSWPAEQWLHNSTEAARSTLQDAGVRVAIGAINFSGIQSKGNGFELNYIVQLRVIVMAAELGDIKASAASAFGRRDRSFPKWATSKQLQPSDLDPLYSLLQTDIPLLSTQLRSRGPSSRKPLIQKMTKRSMPAEELAPMMELIEKFGLLRRVFLHGAHIATNSEGRRVIMPDRGTLCARVPRSRHGNDPAFVSDMLDE